MQKTTTIAFSPTPRYFWPKDCSPTETATPVSWIQLYTINSRLPVQLDATTLPLCPTVCNKHAEPPECYGFSRREFRPPNPGFLSVYLSVSLVSSFPPCPQSGPSPWKSCWMQQRCSLLLCGLASDLTFS